MSDLAMLETSILDHIAAAGDEAALEAVRVAALGKKGSISALLATLGKMSPDERKTQGAAINQAKDKVTEALAARRDVLKSAALDARLASETIDVTLPLRDAPAEAGRIHPLSQVWDELTTIFADMGFSVAEGPDIETDDYNFTKLNFPEGHPAREMHDTFFFHPKEDGSRMLLRTHTSPVQVRTMLSQKPPIRVICPGRTYRIDSDATHTPQFHQVEGLVIDKHSHLGHLKWILHEFCKAFFEVDHINMRFFFGPRSSRSRSRRWKSTSSAAATRARSASARARTGSRFSAAAWCIRTCCAPAASIPTSTRALPGAWASTASPC
ncbi:phenylalanyl-tRNA synthetase alpha subunit [Bradyrhizobium sp. GM5.1]